MKKFECHISVENAESPIISYLQAETELTVAELKSAIDKGALWHGRGKTTQRCRRIKKTLQAGDELHFYYDEAVLNQQPLPAQLVADKQDYSVWYKPYGMLSQGSKWSDHCTIMRWAQKHLTPERAVFSVHRLDRAATGLIIIAHSKKAARALSQMFADHQLEKTYQIIVHGDHSQRPQPETINVPIDDKPARSHFTCVQVNAEKALSLIEVNIESGRKHQIRKHAASIGMPVVGDRLHGDASLNTTIAINEPDLQLSAIRLQFLCPISHAEVCFESPDALRPTLAHFSE